MLSITTKAARLLRSKVSISNKQSLLNDFKSQLFKSSSAINPQGENFKPYILPFFDKIDNSNSIVANQSYQTIAKLKTHDNILFGKPEKFTRSVVNALVLVFIRKFGIRKCFNNNGSLKIDQFKSFLQESFGDDSEFNEQYTKITFRYLTDIKYNYLQQIIELGDYVIAVNDMAEIHIKAYAPEDSNEYITNQYIRSQYDEQDIIRAKSEAVNYVTDKVKSNITNPITDDNAILIRQLIYLLKIINLAMRHLNIYKTGYGVLMDCLKNVFKSLNITTDDEKIRFINSLVIINYHRNCGMYPLRVLKAPIVIGWLCLPVISTIGMVVSGVTTFGVMGAIPGTMGVGGALIEGGGDMMNYGEYTQSIHKYLNCGDPLYSVTKSYQDLEYGLIQLLAKTEDQNKEFFASVPNSDEILELFNQIDTKTINIEHANKIIQVHLGNLAKGAAKKLSVDEINSLLITNINREELGEEVLIMTNTITTHTSEIDILKGQVLELQNRNTELTYTNNLLQEKILDLEERFGNLENKLFNNKLTT